MGLENRDYVRDAPPRGGYGGGYYGYSRGGNWAIKYLIIANIAVFVLQLATNDAVTQYLSLQLTDLTHHFQFWRLLTYGFCHATGGLMHIGFNMLILWMFGRAVEPIYGSREFLLFYLCGIVIAGLCHVGIQAVMGLPPRGVIGASGGVMAVVFLTAMVFPRQKVLLFFVIPIELRWLAVMYAVVDLLGAFDPTSDVAHWAHLGGAAFGVAYKHFNWRISGLWDSIRFRLRRMGSRTRVRIHRPEEEEPRQSDDLSKKVDELLEKISRHGEASLTDEEREILYEASRRYRHR